MTKSKKKKIDTCQVFYQRKHESCPLDDHSVFLPVLILDMTGTRYELQGASCPPHPPSIPAEYYNYVLANCNYLGRILYCKKKDSKFLRSVNTRYCIYI